MGEAEGGIDVYTYGWFLLMYGRNQHHTVSKYPPIKKTKKLKGGDEKAEEHLKTWGAKEGHDGEL